MSSDSGQDTPSQYGPAGQYPPPGQPGAAAPHGQYAPPGQYGQYGFGIQPSSEQFRQQFAQPPGWPGAVMPRRTNSLAIAALCCGIGQVIAGPVAGIPAIVLGIMSIKQIRQTGEDGNGMAVTGLVLGIIGVIAVILVLALLVAVFHSVEHAQQFPGQLPQVPGPPPPIPGG